MRLAIASLALLLAAVLASACGAGAKSQPPTYVSLQVEALDGGSIDVRRYRGKMVVLHLFATWSLATQTDLPQLAEAHDTHGDDLVVIGIALEQDGYRLVAPWREVNQIPYLIALGSPDLITGKTNLGKIAQVPTTILVASDSRILARIDGQLQQGQLASLLAKHGLSPAQSE